MADKSSEGFALHYSGITCLAGRVHIRHGHFVHQHTVTIQSSLLSIKYPIHCQTSQGALL